MIQKRIEQRKRLGNLYNQRMWTRMLTQIIQRFHSKETLRMGQILSEAMTIEEDPLINRTYVS